MLEEGVTVEGAVAGDPMRIHPDVRPDDDDDNDDDDGDDAVMEPGYTSDANGMEIGLTFVAKLADI